MKLNMTDLIGLDILIGPSRVVWKIRQIVPTKLNGKEIVRMRLLITRASPKRKIIVYDRRISLVTAEQEVTHPSANTTHIVFRRKKARIVIRHLKCNIISFAE